MDGQGPIASSFMSTAGRVICPRFISFRKAGISNSPITLFFRSKNPSTKSIGRSTLHSHLLSSQTSSCRLVCQIHLSDGQPSLIVLDSCDINVSPDKRSILLHHETNLIAALKVIIFCELKNTPAEFVICRRRWNRPSHPHGRRTTLKRPNRKQ